MVKGDIVYCQIRKEWVAALPEEFVRQRFLQHMIGDCGYPAPLVVVEKAIENLPHLTLKDREKVPKRRLDIMCFAKNNEKKGELHPLLIVECKAVPLNQLVVGQVIGYNHFVRARFIAIVNETEIRFGWHDGSEYKFIDYLPQFHFLEQIP